MVFVEIANVGMISTGFSPSMTVSELVLQIKHEHNFRFKGDYSLQDTSQSGMIMSPDDEITDGRTYYLTAWLEKV